MIVVFNCYELGVIFELLDLVFIVKLNDGLMLFCNKNDNYELLYNLYEIIGDKVVLFWWEGFDKEYINCFIMIDINVYLKLFYK